jgi:hypothetical protein
LHNRTLWVLLPAGPLALNRETGAPSANPEKIAQVNPKLGGLLPVEWRYYTFTANGLSVKTTDARTWYIHPDTFLASETPPALAAVCIPPPFDGQASSQFLERGLTVGDKWLGVLSEGEAAGLGSTHQFPDMEYQSRRALYAAEVKHPETLGRIAQYSNFRRLTADFVAPGFLAEHRRAGPNAVIYRRDPDSIFVLHMDRLGTNGLLQLARIAGPAGKTVWTAQLPLSVLRSVMPDDQSLLLHGRRYREQKPGDEDTTDPSRTAHGVLVAVDWTTGAIRYHDQGDIEKHPPAVIAP